LNPEEELAESWKGLGKLQQKLASKAKTIEEQIKILEKEIDEMVLKKSQTKTVRIELLKRLCLLSELCGALDFDEMIGAREKFKSLFPVHFSKYLNHLDARPWNIAWSGCLDCRHFAGRCTLNITPIDKPDSTYRLEKYCPSKVKRSPNL
jgi:hypothetical protein